MFDKFFEVGSAIPDEDLGQIWKDHEAMHGVSVPPLVNNKNCVTCVVLAKLFQSHNALKQFIDIDDPGATIDHFGLS